MSNSSRGTIPFNRMLDPPSISAMKTHNQTDVIFQRQSTFFSSPIIANEREFWQFHAQNNKLYFRSEMAFRMWKCSFLILQVRILVAGSSQKTRLESQPPTKCKQSEVHLWLWLWLRLVVCPLSVTPRACLVFGSRARWGVSDQGGQWPLLWTVIVVVFLSSRPLRNTQRGFSRRLGVIYIIMRAYNVHLTLSLVWPRCRWRGGGETGPSVHGNGHGHVWVYSGVTSYLAMSKMQLPCHSPEGLPIDTRGRYRGWEAKSQIYFGTCKFCHLLAVK